ncbi:MAG TPA: hypothetical protein DDX84_05030 [Nitrospiraceae bacterium]|nr:hypothetical protein [Nitrospiraceae bacterium]
MKKIFLLIFISIFLVNIRADSAVTMSDYTATPLFVSSSNVPPLVMLLVQRDERLYRKAYNDYSDLDDDGSWETTYKHSIDYYGYFDPYKCYTHDGSKFVPSNVNTDKYCTGKWSGNFLNWASMSRIDVMRKVLYGGLRSTDSNESGAVLERSFIPQDAHSWVKVYTGTDINQLTPLSDASISLCNTTITSSASPPLLRVARGTWYRWNSLERWQCAYDEEKGANADRPGAADKIGDYIVRVKVADPSLAGTERYKVYPNGNYKPIGLLQQYGDSSNMYFGLITGSYAKNKSGGVLRSKMTDVGDATSGDINRNTGVFTGSNTGIITAINKLRIIRYDYNNGYYNGASNDNCNWGLTSFTDGNCSNWGNPIGEMYYEALRYFSGKTGATSAYDANDSPYISGMPKETWNTQVDPYSYNPACAKAFILTMSDVTPSYDSDQVPGSYFASFSGDLSLNVQTLANSIGTNEGLSGNYFIGQSGATYDSACTAKTVTNLGETRGICPQEPSRQGSYYLPALAYYGQINDLRADKSGTQNITSYSVALSSGAPEINVTVGTSNVKIIPTCKNTSLSPVTSCSLVDFRVVSQTATTGEFYINWEDSMQGGDYDMDADGTLSYTISGNTIEIKTWVKNSSTGYRLYTGYVISGTTTDGVYTEATNNGQNPIPSGASVCPSVYCVTRTHTGGTSTDKSLKDPLWYASKYGGFIDVNGDNKPDSSSEWDKDNDGDPDTYFFVTNPLKMEEELIKALNSIQSRIASGTSVSVLSTSASGAGNIFQSYFLPTKIVDGSREITWLGYMLSLKVDSKGQLRDKNDTCIKFGFNESEEKTYVYNLPETSGICDYNNPTSSAELTSFSNYNWDAGEKLKLMSESNRKIFAFVDADKDGVCDGCITTLDSGESKDFSIGNASTLKPYLRAADTTEAENVIKFIRGIEITNYRDRTCCGTETNEWKLGDIVTSTPTLVSSPAENYQLLYGDKTYATFFENNKTRKTIAYIGVNDGMLHAICAEKTTDGGCYGKGEGEELWAYAPYNLLPHLKWLTDTSYTHIYYIDLRPKVTDINFGTKDSPNWKTVLIGGMRLGGGQISVTDTFDTASETRNFQSAYFALDITDPSTPKVLWEFTDSNLGFTISYPAIVKVGDEWFVVVGSGPKVTYDPTGTPKGPNYEGMSDQSGYIYVIDAKSGALKNKFQTGETKAFLADPLAVDIDFSTGNNYSGTGSGTSYNTEVVYIGETYNSGPHSNPTWAGKLYRLSMNGRNDPQTSGAWTLSTFFDAGKAITSTPTIAIDEKNNLWVYFGTGRYFSSDDKSDSTTQHSFYGIEDPCWDSTNETWTSNCTSLAALKSELFNATNVIVEEGGETVTGVTGVTNWSELISNVVEQPTFKGWYYELSLSGGSERVLTRPSAIGGLVIFTAFTPNTDVCGYGGSSNLYSLYYRTGTAYKESSIGTESPGVGGEPVVSKSISLGYGMASSPAIHVGQEEGAKAFIQTSTGEVKEVKFELELPKSGVISWKEL